MVKVVIDMRGDAVKVVIDMRGDVVKVSILEVSIKNTKFSLGRQGKYLKGV